MSEREVWFIEDGRTLLHEVRSLSLATVDGEGRPQASYAPFVLRDGDLYVFLSELAAHTANLRLNAETSAMVLRDEGRCDDIYARPRLLLRCRAHEVDRGDPSWKPVLDLMEARLGQTASTLRQLRDFRLFRLSALSGQVVSGFARARELQGAQLVQILAA